MEALPHSARDRMPPFQHETVYRAELDYLITSDMELENRPPKRINPHQSLGNGATGSL
jgi:hypothetical protein